jgi:predicted Fe-Mo cluster-binding NifX family protein
LTNLYFEYIFITNLLFKEAQIMKVAIASDDGQSISPHFGRTEGFMIFDIEGKNVKGKEYRKNTFTGHMRGLEGEGHTQDKHQTIINALSDCKVVISNGMGRRLYDDLKMSGIEPIITTETKVQKALELYINSELTDNPEMGCDHHHKEQECDH